MLNINYGHNHKLTEAGRPLYEYSWLIDRVRSKLKSLTIENALSKAIEERYAANYDVNAIYEELRG